MMKVFRKIVKQFQAFKHFNLSTCAKSAMKEATAGSHYFAFGLFYFVADSIMKQGSRKRQTPLGQSESSHIPSDNL